MTGGRGADEFLALRPGISHAALEQLIRLEDLPVSRDETWHAVASVLLATGGEQVLLALNAYGWGTVGGHVEATDLTLRAAATREAHEELGVLLDPTELEPLSFVVDTREVKPGCAHWDFCFARVLTEPIPVTPLSDVRDAAWFPLDALPAVNDHMRQHLDALRSLLAR